MEKGVGIAATNPRKEQVIWHMRITAILLLAACEAFAINQISDAKPLKSEATDKAPTKVRERRSRIHDNPGVPLEQQPEGYPAPTVFADRFGPELPVRDVDAVVLATIRDSQPYLTASKTGIYTEYDADVESVLAARVPLQAGHAITVIAQGGAARLPSGRVVRQFVRGGLPQLPVGARYALFLLEVRDCQCFSVEQAWRLSEGRVRPVFHADVARAAAGTSAAAGMTEEQLIRAVKAEIRKGR